MQKTIKKVKDLPQELRCAFQHFLGARPNVGFRNGSFYSIVWAEHESFWYKLPPETDFYMGEDWGVYPTLEANASAEVQLKMAVMAMNPKNIWCNTAFLNREVKNLIWC